MSTSTKAILAALRALNAKIDALGKRQAEPIVYTRREAAAELKISVSQLYRLLAAGRLTALPSGITREELLRYARSPQTKLRNETRGKREFRASNEAAKVRDWLKSERRRRGAT